MNPLAEKYLRKELLPFLFCPGCGYGTVIHCFLKALDSLGIISDLAMVGGIGCSSWIPTYVKADTLKVLHGRTIPVAVGLKMTNPRRKVVVFSGDGDCFGIGCGHFVNTARLNMDITVIMTNNQIYGMTGGQVSPLTERGARTQTTPYGNLSNPIDGCKLAESSGATFISRWGVSYPRQLARSMEQAIDHKGFSYVEVLTPCPTQTGRYVYRSGDPRDLYQRYKEQCMTISAAEKAPPEQREGRVIVGDFLKKDMPEFCEQSYQLNADLRQKSADKA